MSLIELLVYQTIFIISVALMIYWWQEIKAVGDHMMEINHTMLQEKHIYDLLRYDIARAGNQKNNWSLEGGLSWRTTAGLCKWFVKSGKLCRKWTLENSKSIKTTIATGIRTFTCNYKIEKECVKQVAITLIANNGSTCEWVVAVN